jgi:hypothetical protein
MSTWIRFKNWLKRPIGQDVSIGIIAPIVCLVLDPGIFSEGLLGGSWLSAYHVFVYLGVGIGTLVFAAWLRFGERLRKWGGFFAGIFFFGALFAFGTGLLLLPWSLFGLLIVIGILGFIPFLTARVYFRYGRRALHTAPLQSAKDKAITVGGFILGIVFILGVPTFAQWQTSRIVSESMQLVLHGDALSVEQGIQGLKGAFWCARLCYVDIVDAHRNEEEPSRRALLAKAYKDLTGVQIEYVFRAD